MTNLVTLHPDTLSDSLNVARVRVESVHLSKATPLPGEPDPLPHVSEEYRIVRTKITQLLPTPFRLALTSPSIGDGKTLNAVNLAASMALTGEKRTLLIDADLRRANVHLRLRTPHQPGLAEVLRGEASIQDAIFQAEQLPGLYVLPAGEAQANAAELLQSDRWRTLSNALSADFPQIVADCPPVDLFADYDLIAEACDAVLLVARPDHTERRLLAAALTRLAPKLIGVMINAAPESLFHPGSKHRYHEYYKRGRDSAPGKPVRMK